MAWLSSLPTGHVTSRSKYYDRREDPDDPDGIQVQLHLVKVTEYRGVTYAVADARNASASTATSLSVEIQAIDGGGYNVIETEDIIGGDWISLKYTV